MTTILFLAANPKNTSRLMLDEEIKAIDQKFLQSRYRDMFEIKPHWAVSIDEIQGLLLRHEPDIVHFSGHGSKAGEIILQDDSGSIHTVSVKTLANLFYLFKEQIQCIVLNACYTEKQAKAIAKHIECVIGMSNAIGDQAAINFAASFYQALGFGKDVKTAFELGCNQIDLKNLGEQDTPKLIALRVNPCDIMFVPILKESNEDKHSSTLSKEERDSLQEQLSNYQQNLRYIEERISDYVSPTDVPLTLLKNKDLVETKITELKKKLGDQTSE